MASSNREIGKPVFPVRSASGESFSLLSRVRETDSVTERILLDENTLLGQLEELARSLAIEVRYEPLKKEGAFSTGGLCKLRGEYLLIIHSKASVTDKIEALASALKRLDLTQVYLRPGLRDFLDGFTEQGAPLVQEDLDQ
jgi:hypothetical protein